MGDSSPRYGRKARVRAHSLQQAAQYWSNQPRPACDLANEAFSNTSYVLRDLWPRAPPNYATSLFWRLHLSRSKRIRFEGISGHKLAETVETDSTRPKEWTSQKLIGLMATLKCPFREYGYHVTGSELNGLSNVVRSYGGTQGFQLPVSCTISAQLHPRPSAGGDPKTATTTQLSYRASRHSSCNYSALTIRPALLPDRSHATASLIDSLDRWRVGREGFSTACLIGAVLKYQSNREINEGFQDARVDGHQQQPEVNISETHTRQTSFLRHFHSQQTSTSSPAIPTSSRLWPAIDSPEVGLRNNITSRSTYSHFVLALPLSGRTLWAARNAAGDSDPSRRRSCGFAIHHQHRHCHPRQRSLQHLRSATPFRLGAFHRCAPDKCAEQSEAGRSAQRQPYRWR
nr:hypothetical protein CFP56_07966 [Quercus suber]